jgi:hypothetical protein
MATGLNRVLLWHVLWLPVIMVSALLHSHSRSSHIIHSAPLAPHSSLLSLFSHSQQLSHTIEVSGLQEGLKVKTSALSMNFITTLTPFFSIFEQVRRLPGSDLLVTELCLGTMNFGDQLDEEKSLDLLDAAVSQHGINFIVRLSYSRLA